MGTNTASAASNPSAPAGGDSEAGNTPLHCLNKSTCSLGKWDVVVYLPRIEEYAYTWDGASRTAKIFRCILVSVHDPSKYCMAEVRKERRSEATLREAESKYKSGLKFRLSKVVLTDGKPEYIGAPCKITVNLQKSKVQPVLQHVEIVRPAPSISCADCISFKQYQAFDITALVISVSEARTLPDGRKVRDVCLSDGTTISGVGPPAAASAGDESRHRCVIPKVAMFYSGDPAYVRELVEQAGQTYPFTFFGLAARTEDGGGYKIETSKSWWICERAEGDKATDLKLHAASHFEKSREPDVMTLQTQWVSNESQHEGPGQESFCGHLEHLCQLTNISALDSQLTLWQVNWAFLTIPGDELLTADQSRLWMKVVLQDFSGSTTVWAGEKCMLKLTKQDNKESFIRAFRDGDPIIPTIISAKVARRVRASGDDDSSYGGASLQMVDAEPQSFAEPRTPSSVGLIPLLKSFSGLTSAILPATIGMVVPSNLYTLLVQYPGDDIDAQPCSKVWMLVKAMEKSHWASAGSCTITTDNIQDAFDPVNFPEMPKAQPKKLVAMCTTESMPAFRFLPSRGKPQYGLVVVSSHTSDTLFAESVEILSEDDLAPLQRSMKLEMLLVRHLLSKSNEKPKTWTDEHSPAAAKRCRFLGKSPTDDNEFPLPAPSPAKSQRMG